jgi:L-alanine-DL-glutamate epimerase-like enolase superfamily enzyme
MLGAYDAAMKITSVDTAILRIPTRKPIALDFPYHSLVVAHVHTDEGITGLGYTLAFGGGGVESIRAYLTTRLAPLITGQDPLMVERLWERMYRADRGIKRQGIAAYALSALDIALWDIVGKAAGLPLYKLWGAVTDRVAAYGSGGWPNYALADLIGEAQSYVARGCRYYKMESRRRRGSSPRRGVAPAKPHAGGGQVAFSPGTKAA